MKRKEITGPTFKEMLNPASQPEHLRKKALKAQEDDPLDPVNLFNITFKDPSDRIRYFVVPKELTGVKANIVFLTARDFPTGSHKVGPTYTILMEKIIDKEVDPTQHSLVWPSTGNYGIGGAWVGTRLGYDSVVILPEEMSVERFKQIEQYGGRIIKTSGGESNVKEIYDKCHELVEQQPEKIRILNQFSEWGNYHFHYYVTGNTSLELIRELKERGIGNGSCSAVVSAMGSGGTIAFGDRIKQVYPSNLIVGVEPVQCPTITMNGYGSHDIQGIGDKHVTWIHNVMNMDCMICVDDMESKKGLQLVTDEKGKSFLRENTMIPEETIEEMSEIFGISGICNLLAAIKTARYYDMGEEDVILSVATDNIDRYHSVMKNLDANSGKLNYTESYHRLKSIFHNQKMDHVFEGDYLTRQRWHNLKYYTWVEQQGKSVEELIAQKKQAYWQEKQQEVFKYDRKIREYRKKQRESKSFAE